MSKECNLTDFSKNLKAARETKGFSQQKLADLIGTQKSMIIKYEKIGVNNDKGFPNALTAKRLADALDITLTDLFNKDTSNGKKEIRKHFSLIADILDGLYGDWVIRTNIMTAVYGEHDECIEDNKYQVAVTTNKFPYGSFIEKYKTKMMALNEIKDDYKDDKENVSSVYNDIRNQLIDEYVQKYATKWLSKEEQVKEENNKLT